MKFSKITLLFLLISVSSIAQSGMVFQGIARDNNSAAITDKLMTFTISVAKSDGTELFKETQQIRTDNFGVYAHIIGTGNAVTSTFNNVNFDEPNLKVIIFVNNDGVDTQIYDQPFQYTAYAKHAQNGVPIGTVVAFMGDADKIPDGWVKVEGQDITGAQYATLRATLGNANNLPDTRGEFFKGVGSVDATNVQPIAVRERQIQNVGIHKHPFTFNGNTATDGLHGHIIKHDKGGTPNGIDNTGWDTEFGTQTSIGSAAYWNNTVNDGLATKVVSHLESSHQHAFSINTTTGDRNNQVTGGSQDNIRENRPDAIGVYWIIRYK